MALRIRPAREDDYAFYARVHPELMTGDPVPDAAWWARELVAACDIAEDTDGPVGIVHAQTLAQDGYVRQLIVDPGARRRGVGRALMLHVAARLRAAGVARWRLNVRPTNTAAVALYRALGMEVAWASEGLSIPWSVADALPRAATPPRAGEIAAGDEGRWEDAFDLPRGQLSHGRAAGTKVPLGAESADGGLVGVALFHPLFPGAFPFRVRGGLAVAAALLDAMRALRDPRFDHVRVTVEGDPALAQELRARGAALKLEIVHMIGPVPAAEPAP